MSVNQPAVAAEKSPILLRGLWVIVILALFGLGQSLLCAAAVLQFFWMLFSGKRNDPLAEFGTLLARWLAKAAQFVTAASEEKPFPWSPWNPTA